ncbi:MAG: adenylate cyclase regulatory domain-containing protein [Actinomycetota bacterium]
MTLPEVAQRSGLEVEIMHRIWRALGFPPIEENEVEFNDEDLAALRTLKAVMDQGVPLEDVLALGRVYGASLSRIADAETRMFHSRFVTPREGEDHAQLADRLDPAVRSLVDLSGNLLDHLHRRHLVNALQAFEFTRPSEGQMEQMTVSFVDIADFTRLSGDLVDRELEGLLETFELIVLDACTDAGCRFVKMIGDAAMFVSPDPAKALAAARSVVSDIAGREDFPEARVGIDHGNALPLGGDYFGPAANTAARVTGFARPGTIVVTKDFLAALGDDALDVAKLGSHKLKGVGRVPMFKVRTEPEPAAT